MSIPYTWLYLIHDPYTDYYKIGKSDNPEIRLQQLCANGATIQAAPLDYELLDAWGCPDAVEAMMHEHYAEVRIRGEWFDLASYFDGGEDEEIVVMEFASLLIKYPRLREEGRLDLEEHVEIWQWRAGRHREEIAALERQLERAKLQGYMPALLPASPEVAWDDSVEVF